MILIVRIKQLLKKVSLSFTMHPPLRNTFLRAILETIPPNIKALSFVNLLLAIRRTSTHPLLEKLILLYHEIKKAN